MDSETGSFTYTDGCIDTNESINPTLNQIVEARFSRRATLRGGMASAALAFVGAPLLSSCGSDSKDDKPTVNAGEKITVAAGKLVTLKGTASGGKGDEKVSWTLITGPKVELSGADTNTATFVAPAVASDTTFVFRFTAGQSYADTMVVVTPATLGFNAVAKNKNDIVTVPEGYDVTVLYRLGDPLAAGVAAYANNGSDANFSQRAGDHHDAIHYFGLASSGQGRDDANSSRGLLVMNHENITEDYLHANGFAATVVGGVRDEAAALKEIECHGLSVVEVSKGGAGWAYNPASALNRRITPNTPMVINGPVRGAAAMKTIYSKDGTQARGTINNCANGYTAWGTNLTCEENWAGYFKRPASDDSLRTAAGGTTAKSLATMKRYGVGGSGNYGWSTVKPANPADSTFARWDASVIDMAPADGTGDYRFEPHHMGWVVEIDPYDPKSTPRKRTALGRMGHEGCWPSRFVAGVKPAFYMGDDSRNEYLYKFVSDTAWAAADAQSADRLAIGDKYLDKGTLYVAKFATDGTGTWLPLVFGQGALTAANAAYPFADQADVLINTRIAADAVGATKMDRPEWTAVNPANGEVYLTLTNTSAGARPVTATDAANPRHYNDPKAGKAQYGNPNGHIIRLREANDSSDATTFNWDIYAFGAGADLDKANINLSELDDSNDFSSPDGLWFSRNTNMAGQGKPLLWIQTDDGAFTDVTNCMMLAALPGKVGDGTTPTITNTDANGATAKQATRVGAKPGTNMRRFLVGPKECEITGVDSTPDGKTLFVNIQHPGEGGKASAPTSNWPASQSGAAEGRPRSATIVITRKDGGIVGL